jgi:hypothetical protein
MMAATHSLLYVLVTSLFFVPVIFWIILVAYVFRDIFRSNEMSGVKKAWWALAQFVLPLIGCLLYFVVNGASINQREIRPSEFAKAQVETQAIRAAQIGLELHLGEAFEMAHGALAAQSDQSQLVAAAAQDAKAAQGALVLQAEEMAKLAQRLETAQSVLNEQFDQLSRLAQEFQAARVVQIAQAAQLQELAERAQTNPLGVENQDIEEYIRKVARSKE